MLELRQGFTLMQHQRISLLELQLSQMALGNQQALEQVIMVERRLDALQTSTTVKQLQADDGHHGSRPLHDSLNRSMQWLEQWPGAVPTMEDISQGSSIRNVFPLTLLPKHLMGMVVYHLDDWTVWNLSCASRTIFRFTMHISIAKKRIKCNKLKETCDKQESKRGQATQQLEEAEQAFHSLYRLDLDEMRRMINPISDVKYVLKAMCVLLDEKPSEKGDYWPTARKLMQNSSKFMRMLLNFNRDDVPRKRLARLGPMVVNAKMSADALESLPKALAAIGKWVCAVYSYACGMDALHTAHRTEAHVKAMEELVMSINTSGGAKAKTDCLSASVAETVQLSWQKVSDNLDDDILQFGRLFYDRLFDHEPDLQKVFDLPQEQQARQLVSMLDSMVGALTDSITLQSIAEEHFELVVGSEDYLMAIGSTLHAVLEEVLEDVWTAATNNSWAAAWDVIEAAMLAAA